MRCLSVILFLCAALTVQAADRIFESGPQKVHLIELFTSQGCSSCPSAEAWMSKLKAEPQLWKDFVVTISCAVSVADAFGSRSLLTTTQAMSTLLSKHLQGRVQGEF